MLNEEQLEELAKLKEQGVLSEEEFAKMKNGLIKKIKFSRSDLSKRWF